MNDFLNGFLHRYPYQTLHELNLDWLISAVRELAEEVNNFELVNQFTYEGNWDITKQYKKFAIVTVNGTEGYISLQAVPAGVDITNADYWAMIADYTAIVSGLGARIIALESDMAIVKPQSIYDHAAITSNQIREYNSCVWVGDSYTSAGSLSPDEDKRFSTLVSNELGLTEYNYAVGGTGYIYGSTPYTTQATNAVADFINNNKDQTKVKYCFVMGNRNDADASYSWSQYANAIDTVINTLSNYFTNAKIVIIPAIWDAKPCKMELIHYASIVEERAQMHNNVLYFSDAWTWLTGHENEILWQNGADVHPNTVGHQRIANHIINCLNGNNYNECALYDFTPTSTHADITNASCQIKIMNGLAHFLFKFKCTSTTISGTLMTHTFNSLALKNLFIIDTQVYCETKNKEHSEGALVNVNQVLNKTGDNTGSLTTTVYAYDDLNQFSTTDWNWVEFTVPYGVKRVTFN